MPFDGFSAHRVAEELYELLAGGRIDKIYQPEADQIVMNIRSRGSVFRLLLFVTVVHIGKNLLKEFASI